MRKLIVLDDDPTGTQTVQNVAVLTVWDVETLRNEFRQYAPLFFILTNTRAMPETEAVALNVEICQNLRAVSQELDIDCMLISRSDSTLRGHFPAELHAIEKGLGDAFDAWFLIPFFEEGGRITRNDVHYVLEQGELIPAAETPFAQDATFGYQQSNLKAWVEEKTKGEIAQAEVISIGLQELKNSDLEPLITKISGFKNRRVVVVNAETWRDLLTLATITQRLTHKRFLFRTAASWVKAIKFEVDGISLNPHLSLNPPDTHAVGGLIVVGSYVPKTTVQLRFLIDNNPDITPIELEIERLLADEKTGDYVARISEEIQCRLLNGAHVVVFTSRQLLKTDDPLESLQIGNRISDGLVQLVKRLKTRPRFLIAKGGITSSDVATKALNVKRAIVKGQLLAGIPLWETQSESRFPNLTYVVFPGNVGDETALSEAFRKLTKNS